MRIFCINVILVIYKYEVMIIIYFYILIFLYELFFIVIEKFRCYENICIIYFVLIKCEYCKEENLEGYNVQSELLDVIWNFVMQIY